MSVAPLLLRVVSVVDGFVFCAAALMNFGITLVFVSFESPIWQAGLGEAVIGALLLWAAVTMRPRLLWAAYVLSVFGIAFGLLSVRVVGLAREIHLVLVPLALIGVAILTWRAARRGTSG